MRRLALTVLRAVLLLGGLSLATATSAAAEDTWLSDTWNSVKDFTIEQKDKVVDDSQIAMDKFDLQMDELNAQASEDKAAMSEGWENTKAQLAELRANAQAKLDRLGSATQDNWASVKQEFGDAVQKLEDAYNKARSDQGS